VNSDVWSVEAFRLLAASLWLCDVVARSICREIRRFGDEFWCWLLVSAVALLHAVSMKKVQWPRIHLGRRQLWSVESSWNWFPDGVMQRCAAIIILGWSYRTTGSYAYDDLDGGWREWAEFTALIIANNWKASSKLFSSKVVQNRLNYSKYLPAMLRLRSYIYACDVIKPKILRPSPQPSRPRPRPLTNTARAYAVRLRASHDM